MDERTLTRRVAARKAARTKYEAATAELEAAVVEAYREGMSKYRLAKVTGLARATVDAWTREVERET